MVHDPTARYMGGVAGHAGLFSTADDLARFCPDDARTGRTGTASRIFSPLTVEKFTTPQTPPDQPILRGLGWDIDSPYSGNRGELFPIGSLRPHRLHRNLALDRSRSTRLTSFCWPTACIRIRGRRSRRCAAGSRQSSRPALGIDDSRRRAHRLQRDAQRARACIAKSPATARS